MAINAAAALLWGAIFVTLGYFFGQAIEAMFGRVHLVGILLAGLAALAIGGYFVRHIVVHRWLLSFLPAVLAASLGSFLADQIFFALGRYFRDAVYVRKIRAKPAFNQSRF